MFTEILIIEQLIKNRLLLQKFEEKNCSIILPYLLLLRNQTAVQNCDFMYGQTEFTKTHQT
jgi:hypothetical protein